jgi:hypothetical protein
MGVVDGGYFVGDWVPPALVLAALVLLVSVMIDYPAGAQRRWSSLALGLFTAYAAWTFASLLWSPNLGDAWLGAGQTLLYLLTFWLAVTCVSSGASRRWVMAASVLGPAVVAGFMLPALGPRVEDFFSYDRLSGTIGYFNAQAAFLLVPFWASAYLGGCRDVHPLLRAGVLAGAVLSVDLAVLTQSRGAMVALAASLPVFFLLSGQRLRGLLALLPVATALYVAFPELNTVYLALYYGEAPVAGLMDVVVLPAVWTTAAVVGLYGLAWGLLDRCWKPRNRVISGVGIALLASAAVFLVVGMVVQYERANDPRALIQQDPVTLVQQKWGAFKANDETGKEQSRYLIVSGSGRYAFWQVAWKDFATHPVFGVGTQNYEATYYQLREQDSGFVRQPHMLPLEVLGERGIVGGALFFGFLFICLTAGLRERFNSLNSEGKAQVGALGAAVVYWFVHSSAEWFWQMPAATLPAIVYLGLLVSPWCKDEAAAETSARVFSRWWSLGGVLIALLTVAIVIPLYVADHYREQSEEATDPAERLASVERAQRFNPLDPRLPKQEAELAIETEDWDRAENAYGRAIRLNPEHYAPYMFMARFYEHRREVEKALLYCQKASALNPLDEDIKGHVDQLDDTTK